MLTGCLFFAYEFEPVFFTGLLEHPKQIELSSRWQEVSVEPRSSRIWGLSIIGFRKWNRDKIEFPHDISNRQRKQFFLEALKSHCTMQCKSGHKAAQQLSSHF